MKALQYIMAVAAYLLLAAAPARAADERQIKASVNGAIGFLKNAFATAGNQPVVAGGGEDGGYGEGPAALAGIALIEAGVGLDDPTVQSIAKLVRATAIEQTKTYQLSLDIIFLDKLGEQIDSLLIQSMAARLLYGQTQKGGWTYHCPSLTPEEKERLRNSLQGAVLKGGKDLPTGGAEAANRPKLDPGVQEMLEKGTRIVRGGAAISDDNSNTQFAIVALWSARKHGVPVQRAMDAIKARFVALQNARDGGWSYTSGGVQMSTAPMTCVGLLGLAIAAGEKGERSLRGGKGRIRADGTIDLGASKEAPKPEIPNMLQDPSVKAGLAYLTAAINANRAGNAPGPMGGGGAIGPGAGGPGPMGNAPGRPGGPMGGLPLPGGPTPAAGGGGAAMPAAPGFGVMPPFGASGDLRSDLYFMWSLERVCMVFNLKTIGGKDWHAWGAEYLLKSQMANGSWRGKYDPTVDTSFGLMFMCRSNIVRDLSKMFERSVKGGSGVPAANVPASIAKPVDSEFATLAKALVSAAADKQISLVKEYSEGKGSKYSLALAEAIPKLTGDSQRAARDGLAERMGGLSARSLRGYLQADHPELRRAAALGAAMTDDKDATSLIPQLIETLEDEVEIVWRAARLALKTMTKEDFGPKPGDTDLKRAKAIADWRAWNEKNKSKN